MRSALLALRGPPRLHPRLPNPQPLHPKNAYSKPEGSGRDDTLGREEKRRTSARLQMKRLVVCGGLGSFQHCLLAPPASDIILA